MSISRQIQLLVLVLAGTLLMGCAKEAVTIYTLEGDGYLVRSLASARRTDAPWNPATDNFAVLAAQQWKQALASYRRAGLSDVEIVGRVRSLSDQRVPTLIASFLAKPALGVPNA